MNSIIKKFVWLVMLSMSGAVWSAGSSDYQVEGSLSYTYNEVSSGGFSDDWNDHSGSATYYFNRVNTQDKPLAEAAFLDYAANISISTSNFNPKDLLGVEWESYSVSAEYITENGTYFKVAGQEFEGLEYYQVEFGAFSTDTWLWAIGYNDINSEQNETYLRTKGVFDLEDGQFFNLEAKLVNSFKMEADIGIPQWADKNINRFELAMDYYLNTRLSIGVEKKFLLHGTDVLSNTSALRAKFFVTPRFAFYGSYSQDMMDLHDFNIFTVALTEYSGFDYDIIRVGANVRF